MKKLNRGKIGKHLNAEITEKLDWGKIGKHLNADLLNMTNISSFFSQEIIDALNSAFEKSNRSAVTIKDKDNHDIDFYFHEYHNDGNNKYSYYKAYEDPVTKARVLTYPPNSSISGDIETGEIFGGKYYPGVKCKTAKNEYGTWRYCQIQFADYDKPLSKGYNILKDLRDSTIVIEQDYDGSISYFKGKTCLVKMNVKRNGLAKISEADPRNLGSKQLN